MLEKFWQKHWMSLFLMLGKKHHLFTLGTHSVRSVSVHKGKNESSRV